MKKDTISILRNPYGRTGEEKRQAALDAADELEKLEKKKKYIQNAHNIQCSDGNWNYDPYMHGMANGIIFAKAVMEDKEPIYLNPPEKWISEFREENRKLDHIKFSLW